MARNDSRIDTYSLIIGILLALAAQGIYDFVFYLLEGKINEEVLSLELAINILTLAIIVALVMSIYRARIKKQKHSN